MPETLITLSSDDNIYNTPIKIILFGCTTSTPWIQDDADTLFSALKESLGSQEIILFRTEVTFPWSLQEHNLQG